MNQRITNFKLTELLFKLGFECRDARKPKFVTWHHPISGCEFELPGNKSQEAVRPAELAGIKAHLDMQGHLDERDFEQFLADGRLPADLRK